MSREQGSWVADPWQNSLGDNWGPLFSQNRGENRLTVYANKDDRQQVKILRNDNVWPHGSVTELPGLGSVRVYDLLDDPALRELGSALQCYSHYDVLRYRPSKRVTIGVDDLTFGPAIIKCIANGVDDVVTRLESIWRARAELDFRASEPLAKHRSKTVFLQRRLSGQQLSFDGAAQCATLANRISVAMSSLHDSTIQFETRFGAAEQGRRSERYLAKIEAQHPGLADIVRPLRVDLGEIEQTIVSSDRPMVPIHGSLHSHQWLLSNDGLALVDFDRAAMGHAELDIATFLAEWDYEPGTLSRVVKQSFMAAISGADESLINFYRAHKHVSKAFKATKASDGAAARIKCRRNLENAWRIIS